MKGNLPPLPTLFTKSRRAASTILLSSLLAGTALSAQASANSQAALNSPGLTTISQNTTNLSQISQIFSPQPTGRSTQLDYDILQSAFDGTVIYLGPSARRHMGLPSFYRQTQGRISKGHRSPYRLEGSRVGFSFFETGFIEELSAYRKDLEELATREDITTLHKDEQLAFWFNLHNVAMIEHIATQYPVRRPSTIKINGQPLHDAKIINIKNTSLSLRDIREKIVYTHWDDPKVMYGFFHGDIGSPALQDVPYHRDNLHSELRYQAEDFVNSLRGFNITKGERRISRHYLDAAPYFFPNFEQDLTAHMVKYARPEVGSEIRQDLPFVQDRYDDIIADMVGGDRPRTAGFFVESAADGDTISTFSTQQVLGIPSEARSLIREVRRKLEVLRERDIIGPTSGQTSIEDIETDDGIDGNDYEDTPFLPGSE